MQITEIQIIPINIREGMIGFCQFLLNGDLKISNVAIHTRKDGAGIRLVYPQTKNGMPTVNPISLKLGQQIEKAVLKVYLDFLNKK